ncbi:hypothetical protein [Vibrio owensii]|uniref:hypothetical protein n=1 Tax=Vibrio owensii TaxID=696485 RepID=UPI0018F22948|nr:hypothetical protein [Vibrio owensii]
MNNYDEQTRFIANMLLQSECASGTRVIRKILREETGEQLQVPEPEHYELLLSIFLPKAEKLIFGGKVVLGNNVYQMRGDQLTKTVNVTRSDTYLGDRSMEAINAKYFAKKVTASYLVFGGSLKANHEELYGIITKESVEAKRVNELMLKMRMIRANDDGLSQLIWLGDGFYYSPMVGHVDADFKQKGCVFNGKEWVTFHCGVETEHYAIANDIKSILVGAKRLTL